jgi:hypothetical protein
MLAYVLGNYISGTGMLAELDAFVAARFATSPIFTVFRLDSLSIWTVIVIVVHISMCRRIFNRVCVVRSYLGHRESPS